MLRAPTAALLLTSPVPDFSSWEFGTPFGTNVGVSLEHVPRIGERFSVKIWCPTDFFLLIGLRPASLQWGAATLNQTLDRVIYVPRGPFLVEAPNHTTLRRASNDVHTYYTFTVPREFDGVVMYWQAVSVNPYGASRTLETHFGY